jgi:hypothetical protein
MSSTIVTLTGDATALDRAFTIIQRAQDKTDAKFGDMKAVAKDYSKAFERDMAQAADATNKAWNESVRELRKMGPEGRAAAEAIEGHLRATGQAGRQSFESIISKIGEIDDAAAAAAQNARDELDKGTAGISDNVVEYAKAWLSVGAAVGVIKAGLAEVRAEQEKSLESLQGLAEPERRLAQIATSAQDLDQMLAQADQLSERFGMSREASRGLIFSARSEGFTGDIDTVARASRVVDTEAQAKLVGVLARQFGTGTSAAQNLSAVLTAAGGSAFNFETVGANVVKSAAAARASGADLPETLAANAQLANLIGDAAGDRVRAFASMASLDPELQGKGIMGAVDAISKMTDKQRLDVLGSGMEVNEAYRLLLENSKAVRESSEAIRADIAATAGGGGALSGALATVEGSTRFMTREQVARAQLSQEIATEARLSGDEAAFQAGLAGARAEAFRNGGGAMAGAFGSLAARGIRASTGDLLGGGTAAAVGGEIASMSDAELAASASPMGALLQFVGAVTRLGGRVGGGSGDPVVEELKGIRANTSPGPVFTGSSLQGPLQSAAQP